MVFFDIFYYNYHNLCFRNVIWQNFTSFLFCQVLQKYKIILMESILSGLIIFSFFGSCNNIRWIYNIGKESYLLSLRKIQNKAFMYFT